MGHLYTQFVESEKKFWKFTLSETSDIFVNDNLNSIKRLNCKHEIGFCYNNIN